MSDEDEIVLEAECKKISGGLHQTTRWRLEQKGLFPRRFKVGNPDAPNGRVGWSRSELRAWREERMARRGPPGAALDQSSGKRPRRTGRTGPEICQASGNAAQRPVLERRT